MRESSLQFAKMVIPPPHYLRLAQLLVRREAGAKLSSPWFYGVATVVCLISFLYGSGFQHSFETESILVTSDPLMALNLMVVVFLGLVLGLRLATSLSWEREHRTLEVLLVGPVPWSAVVVAKFLVELCVLALIIGIYWLYLVLGQPMGRGVIGLADTLSITQAPLFVLPVLALGLLVSAWARSVRAAVVAYLVIVGILAIFEAVLGILKTMPVEEMSLSSLYLRAGLETVAPFVQPFSAIASLSGLIERLFSQNAIGFVDVGSALALTVGTLIAAFVVARIRGTQG